MTYHLSLEELTPAQHRALDSFHTKDIAKRLKALRTMIAVTLPQMAKLTGIDRHKLRTYENGIIHPEPTILTLYCRYSGVNLNTLLGIDNSSAIRDYLLTQSPTPIPETKPA